MLRKSHIWWAITTYLTSASCLKMNTVVRPENSWASTSPKKLIRHMLGFYKKAILIFLVLLALTFVLALVCWDLVFVRAALMPPADSVIPWKLETITDKHRGGTSSITVNDSDLKLDFDYVVTQQAEFPQVTAVFAFAELKSAKHLVDLSRYTAVSFRATCEPRNVLAFHLHTFDPKFTDPG